MADDTRKRRAAERPSALPARATAASILLGRVARIPAHEAARQRERAKALIAEAAALVGHDEARHLLSSLTINTRQRGRPPGTRKDEHLSGWVRHALLMQKWPTDHAAALWLTAMTWTHFSSTQAMERVALVRRFQRRIAYEREHAANLTASLIRGLQEVEAVNPTMAARMREKVAPIVRLNAAIAFGPD